VAAPLRVGILNDMADGPPGLPDLDHWLRLAAKELVENGRLDRDIELVYGWGLGLPSGTAAKVERAFRDLVDQDVLLIVGPAIGDNALVATPLAEQHRVPTINWAGAERARGHYMFHLQVGSHEDESIVLARHVAALGLGRVGVVYDRSPIGRRHLLYLQSEADIIGLHIASAIGVAPLAEDATVQVEEIMDAGVDALLYLGLGLAAPAVARALSDRGWSGPRLMNTAGIRGHYGDFASVIDGWIYVDMYSDENRTLAGLRERFDIPPARSLAAANGYDLGRLVAEGLARAPERTRDGVVEGLEQIKWLPAAEGQEGTTLGFGIRDRGALHGRYLVLRQWRDGVSVEVGG
jgi:ABC-type branched-subunit amino acid transport system substrate-binding protein